MVKNKIGSWQFYVIVALLVLFGAAIAGKLAYDDNQMLSSLEGRIVKGDYSDPEIVANHSVFSSEEWSNYIELIDSTQIYSPNESIQAAEDAESIIYPWNKTKAVEQVELIKENDIVFQQNPALVFSGYPITDAVLVDAVERIRDESKERNVPFETLIEEWDITTEQEKYRKGEETEGYILEIIFNDDFSLKEPTEENKKAIEYAIKFAILELNKEETLKSSLDVFTEEADIQ